MTQAASTPLSRPRPFGWLSRPLAWLAAPSPAVRYGVRWGAAISAALWLAHGSVLGHGLPQPTFLFFTVLFVALPTAGASIQKAVYRIIGTLLAAGAAVVIWGWSAQLPALEMLLIFLVYAAGVYWMAGPRSQYIGVVLAFTTGIILGDAYPFSDTEVEWVAFERVTLVILGIGLVFVAESLIWPVRVGKILHETLAGRAEVVREELSACLGALQAGRPPAAAPRPPSPLAAELPLAGQFRMELGVSRAQGDAAERATVQLEILALRTQQLRELLGATPARSRPDSFRAVVDDLRGAVDAALVEARAALSEERAPEPFAGRIQAAYAAFEEERIAALEARMDGRDPTGESSLAGLAHRARPGPIIRDLVLILGRLESSLLTLSGDSVEARVPLHGKPPPFWRRFHIDLFQLQTGMRGGLAACLALWLVLALGWSANSLVMTLAFMFAAKATFRTTRGGLLMLLKVTIIGSLIADFSLVYITPHLQRMPLALVYPFSVMAVLGYLSVSRPKTFGPSAALYALIIIAPIFIPPSAPTDVYGPYSTATYIAAAALASAFASLAFWPASATQLFWKRSAAQLELCRQIVESVRTGADFRSDRIGERLEAFGKQLAMLSQLHVEAQTDPDNEPADDRRRADLLARIQAVLDAVLQVRAVSAVDRERASIVAVSELVELRAALSGQDEAISASMEAAAASLGENELGSASPLAEAHRAVEAEVEALRGNREIARALGARAVYDFVAYADARVQLAAAQLDIEHWIADWRASEATS